MSAKGVSSVSLDAHCNVLCMRIPYCRLWLTPHTGLPLRACNLIRLGGRLSRHEEQPHVPIIQPTLIVVTTLWITGGCGLRRADRSQDVELRCALQCDVLRNNKLTQSYLSARCNPRSQMKPIESAPSSALFLSRQSRSVLTEAAVNQHPTCNMWRGGRKGRICIVGPTRINHNLMPIPNSIQNKTCTQVQ